MIKMISRFFKNLLGLRPCDTMASLKRYIRVGDVFHLSFWINQNIWYTKDETPADEWRDPELTLKLKKGDCEDVAIIAHDVIASWPKWKAMILCVYWNEGEVRKGHAVCCFETPDMRKGYLDGNVYIRTQSSWKKIAQGVRKGVDSARWTRRDGSVIAKLL